MKKVAFKRPEETVFVEDLSEHSIIGLQFTASGDKGQVAKVDNCTWVIHEPGDRNTYNSKIIGESIQDLLTTQLGHATFDVFVFGSREEFVDWLSE